MDVRDVSRIRGIRPMSAHLKNKNKKQKAKKRTQQTSTACMHIVLFINNQGCKNISYTKQDSGQK